MQVGVAPLHGTHARKRGTSIKRQSTVGLLLLLLLLGLL